LIDQSRAGSSDQIVAQEQAKRQELALAKKRLRTWLSVRWRSSGVGPMVGGSCGRSSDFVFLQLSRSAVGEAPAGVYNQSWGARCATASCVHGSTALSIKGFA